MEIIPAILTGDPKTARDLLDEIKKTGKFKRVQIDFIDGEYNNNLSITPEDIDMTPYLMMNFDAHLMVVERNIEKYRRQAVKVGFDRIIPQMESISNPEDFSGLALDVHTPVAAIEKYLPGLEVVIVMSIEPGFGGQVYDPRAKEKIKRLRFLRSSGDLRFRICVDGGVEREMLDDLEKCGADEVAMGAKRVLLWNDDG